MLLLPLIAIPSMVASLVGADTLPEGFYGRFRLGRSDNFDEYLTAKGEISTRCFWQFDNFDQYQSA